MLTETQAEMLFDDADEDRSGSVDLEEFASRWADFDASYGISTKLARQKLKKSKSKAGALVAAAGSAVSAVVRPGKRRESGAGAPAAARGGKAKAGTRV